MEYIKFMFGVLAGGLLTVSLYRMRSAFGTLLIDQTDPEKDKYRLDIDNLDILSKKRRVILKIDKNADLSQD